MAEIGGRGGDPRRIGRYRVVRRFGAGGMGVVYEGTDEDGRSVAIKVIRAEYADDPMFRARFSQEVAAGRRVRRFCTAPIIDAEPDANPPYLVTEFVNGPSLHDQITTGGPLHGADLEALAVGVAAALTAIHDAGVVHRDLKPANVLLSPFGPRVIDFGVARVMDLTRLSLDGSVLGTPSYMAPEQIRGKPVTAAADVFAWAAVVAFAAYGQPPFQAESPAAVMHQILNSEPNLGGLDGALYDQVRAAFSKLADRRPTAHDILRNLISSGVPATAADVLDTATSDPVTGKEPHRQEPPTGNIATEPPPDTDQPRGTEEAEFWYRRAAEAGDAQAMNNLGLLLYQRGRIQEAESWYRRAADAGLEHQYREAADAGNAQAMNDLGWLLEQQGQIEEAERWYRKGADAGNAWALNNLGRLLEQRGQIQEAESWYRRAADAGSDWAMRNLGWLLHRRGEADEAERWYRKAIGAGNVWALNNLGWLLEQRGQIQEAESWYRRAADAGEVEGMKNLARLLAAWRKA